MKKESKTIKLKDIATIALHTKTYKKVFHSKYVDKNIIIFKLKSGKSITLVL